MRMPPTKSLEDHRWIPHSHNDSRHDRRRRTERRRRASCTYGITFFAVATIVLVSSTSAITSLLLLPRNDCGICASAATTAAPSMSSASETSAFLFSLLKRRRTQQQRLAEEKEEQQRTALLLDYGEVDGGRLAVKQRVDITNNGRNRALVFTTRTKNEISHSKINGFPHSNILPNGHTQSTSLAEFDLARDEPYTTALHPIDNAYDSHSQTPNTTKATTLRDKNFSQSLDSMEGSEDDHVSYIRMLEDDSRDEGFKNEIDNAPSAANTRTSSIKAVDDSSLSKDTSSSTTTTTTWAKRNARSIDEGIRFKFQLREGLEERSKLHREQLLSDLLQGVIRGTSTALDAEPDVTIMKRNITNPIRLWWSEKFGKRGEDEVTTSPVAEIDDIGNIGPALTLPESETSIQPPPTPIDKSNKSAFYSRTITGLLMALAEEVEGLEVNVDADDSTPFWNKTFNSININFNRLGFRQLRFGGLENVLNELEETLAPSEKFTFARGLFNAGGKPTTADEAFEKIDVDNSGSLDEEELGQALKMAAILGGNKFGARSKEVVADMASKLIRLYDTNGDGVVDRDEYRVLVQDMSALRDARLREEFHQQTVISDNEKRGWLRRIRKVVSNADKNDDVSSTSDESIIDITDDENFWESIDHGEGSIVFKDMTLDLRRLLFGLIPGMKRILPGGPLILKPFTATVTASWTREDIMDSFLIDAGLRRLVARALSRRVRGIRDLFDGAVFYGRTWKLFEQNAPLVEVQKLEDVQFDWRDRLIITGRAKIKAAPDAPSIENGFKLRTKIGTRGNGRIIGLLEPEIAIFAECPRNIENAVRTNCKKLFGYTIPRFEPLYTFIPLVSPLKKNDKMDGFNMGEDNQLKSIEIKNGRLCFEFSAVLRPGRFLGNHYMAFTVPNRTLILTLDRVKEGIRNARRNKRLAERAAKEVQKLAEADSTYNAILTEDTTGKITSISPEGKLRIRRLENELKATIKDELVLREIEGSTKVAGKSFFSKFVEGYSGAIREELDLEMNARLSSSISNFFGTQESTEDGGSGAETNFSI